MSNYIGQFLISEGLRSAFITILLVGNFLSINCSCVYMILSWYIKVSLDKQITFLKDYYQPAAIPVSMVITSVTMMVASIIGIKAAIGGRFDDEDVNEERHNVKSCATFMLVFWISAAIVCIFVCATSIVCFVEIYELETALGKGLKIAMMRYRTDGALKAEIDFLQMDYKCCGVTTFRDWFNISWVDLQYLDVTSDDVKKRIKEGYYYGDDVPFSCCRLKVPRPCVDTRIMDNKYHSNYNKDNDITMNTTGCREAIVQFLGHVIFKSVGLFVLTCLFVWLIMLVSARYLQTSMSSIANGEPAYGWLIGINMGQLKSKRKSAGTVAKKVKSEEYIEEDSDENYDDV